MIPHQGRGEGPDESASNTGDQAHRGEKKKKGNRGELMGCSSYYKTGHGCPTSASCSEVVPRCEQCAVCRSGLGLELP